MKGLARTLCLTLLVGLAGCTERPSAKIIEGHWVAEKFRVRGSGLPIGPNLHITQDQLGFAATFHR